MITIEINEKPDFKWNERMLNNNAASIYQTKEYGLFKKLRGQQPFFLKFIDGKGEILAQLLLISNSPSEKKSTKLHKILRKVPISKKIVYKWKYGPVVFNTDLKEQICNTLSDFLISKKNKIIGSEHPLCSGFLSTLKEPYTIINWSTFLLNLNEEPEKLWKKMEKHSARKNIERSQERGVVVKEMNKNDFLLYSEMTGKEGRGSKMTSSIAEKQWDILKSAGFTGFFAYEKDIPIAGMSIGYFNGYINEFNIVRTDRDYSRKFYSQDLLKWKIIEWAIEKHHRFYDLTGVNPNPSNEKEQGIYRYKKKWGGNLINYNRITL